MLSENLKRIRKDNNLSQEQLAEKLGVSRQSVSKWENGEAYPEMDKVLHYVILLFFLFFVRIICMQLKLVKKQL